MEIPKSRATSWRSPMTTNSVVPMPNAPAARAQMAIGILFLLDDSLLTTSPEVGSNRIGRSWGGSALDQREVSFVVASTADRLQIQCGLDRADLGGGQLQSGGSRVVFYVLERSGARYRHDEVALSQEPRQRELCGSAPLSPGHLAEQFEDTQIPSERLRLEPRERLAEIRRGQLISGRQLAREETSSERAVRDEADSELPADPKDTALGLPAPEGVLALNGRDRMNSMGGAEGGSRYLAQSEMTYLARGYKVCHGSNDVFDRDRRIYPVLIEQIDGIDVQALEGLLDHFADVARPAVDPDHALQPVTMRQDLESELGRDLDAIARKSFNGLAEQLFVREWTVDLCRVEEGDAELESPVNCADRVIIQRAAVCEAHAHAAQAQRRDCEPTVSQLTLIHDDLRLLSMSAI